MVSCLWTDSRWKSISPWAFPPWGILPLLKFDQALNTSLWPAGVCFSPWLLYGQPKVSQMRLLSSCSISFVGRAWLSGGCYPECSWPFCQPPFLSWPVRSCSLLPTVNQAELCQIMQCYTQPQEPGWDLQIHFHMQLKPRSFSQVCSGVEKKWDTKGQTSSIGG